MFLLDALKDVYDLVLSIFITVPLDNTLSTVYVIGNFILQILFLGSDPSGGGFNFPG